MIFSISNYIISVMAVALCGILENMILRKSNLIHSLPSADCIPNHNSSKVKFCVDFCLFFYISFSPRYLDPLFSKSISSQINSFICIFNSISGLVLDPSLEHTALALFKKLPVLLEVLVMKL